ncbi:MAG: SEL1-like repeat protein [Kordiimonadaceae bacterium]|nr:SEL1-like repeat protein [Kordiimonadaceae bacterium]
MGQTDKYLYKYVRERLNLAETGRADALYDLGLLYSTGHGVDQNFIEAHKWFNLATERGLNRAEIDRHDVALELDTQEIVTALKLARDWSKSHSLM